MSRHRRPVVARRRNQFAKVQFCQGALRRALGESGFVGDHAQTCLDRLPALPRGAAIEKQINEKRGGLLIVPDDVAQENVEDVVIDWDGLAKARHFRFWLYTDNRTRLFVSKQRLILDDRKVRALVCAMIKQIKFVSVPVADQDRALDFYTEKLGFTIITDQPFDDKQRWIELRVPKAETRVVLFTPEGDEKRIGTFMNMSYACDDIDKTYAELKKQGVEFGGAPQKEPWGTYAMVKDSEGNRFVVSSD